MYSVACRRPMSREGLLKGDGKMAKKIEFPEDLYTPTDFKDFIASKEFKKLSVFTDQQIDVLAEILDMLDFRMNWHNEDADQEEHKNIRQKIDKLEARFRNHRHEMTRNFCGRAEY